ncbi:MAG: monofunctional biosynthetic peptidoglycan transglycosylase [Rhodospirillaceae bacterium]|nr:monofunctional biosynthetic peptidoglycan transglycosylase [Rhodospirillaceae bacterium]
MTTGDAEKPAARDTGPRRNRTPPGRRSLARRVGRLLFRGLAVLFILSVLLVVLFGVVPVPATPLMVIRLAEGRGWHHDWVPLEDISPNLVRAVIAAEDARFCEHFGFDLEAIEEAWQRNQRGRRVRGASTISMQTAKNLFLWPGRDWVRKGLEAYFTVLIELAWSKHRIMEVYLNVIEMGPGIYGAQAAARAHFGKAARALSAREAALLASVLPNPLRWSPAKPTGYIARRASIIQGRMATVAADGLGACV